MEETIERPALDKTKWGPGPWQTEPDRIDWINSGFSCMALRNGFGVWCGYVGVPKSHPDYGASRDDVGVYVYGGLTYANECWRHICHVPAPGMPDKVWWFGFDCAHGLDFIPSTNILRAHINLQDDLVYRDADFIKAETNRLAAQLKEREKTNEHP